MTRHALLGLALIVFGVLGLAIGIARVAPGSNGTDVAVSVVAALLGGAALLLLVRVGRRGAHPQTRWLIVPVLVAALFVDRLSERWQLALLAFGAGYVAAFLANVVVRAARIIR